MVIVVDILRQVALDWVYADSCQCPKNKGIINFCSSCMVGLGGYLGTTNKGIINFCSSCMVGLGGSLGTTPAISKKPGDFSLVTSLFFSHKHDQVLYSWIKTWNRWDRFQSQAPAISGSSDYLWTTWTTWATRFLPEEWLPDEPCAVDVIESSQCHGCSRKMVDPKSQMFPNPNAPWCWYIYHYLPT